MHIIFSQDYEAFLNNLKIENKKSSICHPQSNGLIERVHKIIKEIIAVIFDKMLDWLQKLFVFKLHYDNPTYAVTKFSPAQLFFGRRLNIPIDSNNQPNFIEKFHDYLNRFKKTSRRIQ